METDLKPVMKNEKLKQLMTYGELAQALCVSPGTLRNWVSQRFIPHLKIGRAVRFDPRDIERWIDKRAQPGRLTWRYRGSEME